MNMDRITIIYEENKQLDMEIQDILNSGISDRNKIKRLGILQDSVQTPLGRSHIAYYIEQLRLHMKERYKRMIGVLVIGIWSGYIIWRTYLHMKPEKYTIASILGATSLQVVYAMFMLPFILLAYYIIVYLLSLKK